MRLYGSTRGFGQIGNEGYGLLSLPLSSLILEARIARGRGQKVHAFVLRGLLHGLCFFPPQEIFCRVRFVSSVFSLDAPVPPVPPVLFSKYCKSEPHGPEQ